MPIQSSLMGLSRGLLALVAISFSVSTVLATNTVFASTASASTPDSLGLDLSPCDLPGLDRPAQCGTLPVAEDPANPYGRNNPLQVAVISSRGESALPDPVFYLVGGPIVEYRPLAGPGRRSSRQEMINGN